MRPLHLLALLFAAVLIAPMFATHDPMQTDTSLSLQPPGTAHLLGTDRLGRDVWSRLLHGGQRTLMIAAAATLIAAASGGTVGLAAGSTSRWLDRILSALINALLAFPGLLLALVVITLMGANVAAVTIATGVALCAGFARVTRAAVLSVRGLDYVDAARSLGVSEWGLMTRHIFPNIVPTLLAYTGVTFSYSLLNSAALSFLGLAGDLGAADWGTMLFEGRLVFRSAPWVSIAPGLAITTVVLVVEADVPPDD